MNEFGLRNLSGGGEIRRRLLQTSLTKLAEIAKQYVNQATVDRQTLIALTGMGDAILELGAEEMGSSPTDLAASGQSPNRTSAVKLAES